MKKTGQPYANWKDAGDYHAIVIGSGIGGLAAAALLAKHGDKKVLVLERHTKAGGFTHAFGRKDWDWDVGVHYIGQVHHEGSMLRRLFDEVGDGSLQWEPMGEVYDTVVIGGQRWEYVSGREAWRERMHSYFPDETSAIDRYLEQVREAIGGARTFFAEKALPGPAAVVAGPWMRRKFLRHSQRTLGEVLDGITDNATLKAVLAAQFGDHGLPPSEASFVIPRRRRLSDRRRLEDCRVGGTGDRSNRWGHRRLRRGGVGVDRERSRDRRAHDRWQGNQGRSGGERRRGPQHGLPSPTRGYTGSRDLEGDASTDLTIGLTHLPLCGSRCHR
jgi:hypothetical protein